MSIFSTLVRLLKGESKPTKLLLIELEAALSNLLEICNKLKLFEDILADVKSFVSKMLRRISIYKNNYPGVEIFMFKRWINNSISDAVNIEELFENIRDKKQRRSCIAAIERIESILEQIEEGLPVVRKRT